MHDQIPRQKDPRFTGNLHPLSLITPPHPVGGRGNQNSAPPTPTKKILQNFHENGANFAGGGILPGVGKNKDRCPPGGGRKIGTLAEKIPLAGKMPPLPDEGGERLPPLLSAIGIASIGISH